MLTVGHSNRLIGDFLDLLQAHGVELLVDVRSVPKSRYNPQFAKEALAESLHAAGIRYLHMPALGGLRHPRRDSRNTGWRNDSFRGYADYMETPEFVHAIDELLALDGQVTVMCAEAVPWRCHRSLIADALLARGVEARHIMTVKRADAHKLTSFARVQDGRVTYPSPEADLFEGA